MVFGAVLMLHLALTPWGVGGTGTRTVGTSSEVTNTEVVSMVSAQRNILVVNIPSGSEVTPIDVSSLT